MGINNNEVKTVALRHGGVDFANFFFRIKANHRYMCDG